MTLEKMLKRVPLVVLPALALAALAMASSQRPAGPEQPAVEPLAPIATPAPAVHAARLAPQAVAPRAAMAHPAPPAPPPPADAVSALAPPPPPPPPVSASDRDEDSEPPAQERSRTRRAWLGVVLGGDEMTRILSVTEDSPAEQAGLKKGDQIVSIGGDRVEEYDDIAGSMREHGPGDRVSIVVDREGDEKTFTVTLGERPGSYRYRYRSTPEAAPHVYHYHDDDDEGDVEKEIVIVGPSRNFLGVQVHEMSEDLRAALKAPRDRGVLVNRVVEDSPASEAGLKAGDIIVGVDGKAVEDTGDIARALREHEPGDEVPVAVIRDGSERTLDVKVARRPGRPGPRGFMRMPGFDFDWEGMVPEVDAEAIRRAVHEAMQQYHDAMKQQQDALRESNEAMRQLNQQINEEMRRQQQEIRKKIRDEVQREIERGTGAARARTVFDI